MKIAINGAGIAGTAIAYWLRQSGHEVLLVEQAPRLRSGGYAIDFWGIGFDIAERMGLIPRILELGYQPKDLRFVDKQGHQRGGFPVAVLARMTKGRFTELRRSDLAAVIYEALDDGVETIFGDSVANIEDDGGRVHIELQRAGPREVDLLIGADGLHSRVRRLRFGPEQDFEVSLGYHVAAFEIEGYRPREELVAVSHAVPGRQITRLSLRDDRTLFLFVFRDEYLSAATPSSEQGRKSALRSAFAGVGWERAQILEAMEGAGDIYFDRVSQIRMQHWTTGRTALLGDAAACVSLLAGEGTGLAMAEAYVLAGELHACAGNHAAAFARYQNRLMPFLLRKQEAARGFASSFAPKSRFGIFVRNQATRWLRIPFIANALMGRAVRDDIELPTYYQGRTDPVPAAHGGIFAG